MVTYRTMEKDLVKHGVYIWTKKLIVFTTLKQYNTFYWAVSPAIVLTTGISNCPVFSTSVSTNIVTSRTTGILNFELFHQPVAEYICVVTALQRVFLRNLQFLLSKLKLVLICI